MVGTPAASAVFDFENILPQLDFLPIAARRALDHAGLRLSLEAWRSLGLEDRCQLVAAGADDIVDSSAVAGVVRRASPPAQRIEVVGDPDPLAPPDGLTRLLEPVPLDARQWARLRALDRYALAHVHRRSIARNDPSLIQAAYEDIVTGHLRSLRPGPSESAGRGSSAPLPQVPGPPPLPRSNDPMRAARGPDPASSPGRVQEARGYDATPPPGRVQEARGYDATPPSPGRVQEARGYDPTPSPGRVQESRGQEMPPPGVRVPEPPFRSFDASLPVPDAPPAATRGARVPDLRYQEPLDLGFDDPPTVDRGPGPQARPSSAPPPPASRPSTRPTPPSRRAVDVFAALAEEELRLSNHLNDAGDAHMVDVGPKPVTARRAVASATVRMRRETFRRLATRDTPKGDVLAAARIAGIQAAKRTSELIPLCHIVALTHVEVQLDLDGAAFCVHITATAEAMDRTGVEMEAMVAASVAGLTIYDMLKGIDREMSIDEVKLLEKSGGKSGNFRRREA
jgi:cyclic pyranopterin phosphate synthase